MPDLSPDLSVELGRWEGRRLALASPLIIAAGCFGSDGFGAGVDLVALAGSGVGAVVIKSVTLRPRAGNPEPRRYPADWSAGSGDGSGGVSGADFVRLNSVGLANPGIERVLAEYAPAWAEWPFPVILSLAGTSPEEFGELAARCVGAPGIAGLELNLSCPNVGGAGGSGSGVGPGTVLAASGQLAAQAVIDARLCYSGPLWVKLAPNVAQLEFVARGCLRSGADALVVSNTMPALCIDVDTRRPVLGAGAGGLSGAALRPVALGLTQRVSNVVAAMPQGFNRVPVIGAGGVFTGRHAAEYFLAGASAVQVGTAFLEDAGALGRIQAELTAYLGEQGIEKVGELTGALRGAGVG